MLPVWGILGWSLGIWLLDLGVEGLWQEVWGQGVGFGDQGFVCMDECLMLVFQGLGVGSEDYLEQSSLLRRFGGQGMGPED